MPIGPTSGFLDFTNATPRANVIIALSNVGVGTDVPLHALDIRGTANVADIIINNDLTLIGGLTTNTLTINSVSMSTTSNFQQVTNVGDAATTNTVQFTNPTTGFTVSSNAEVGGELSVSGNTEVGTANLFVDTTTGNVGVGTTEPTESLDIVGNLNLQKVSNTASIKLNSNAVTEFARSKKSLIKYPRVAMTSTSQDGYVISSSTADTNSSRTQYGAFDGIFDNSAGQGWQSLTRYSTSTGLPTGDADNATFTVAGTNYKGQWLKLQLPQKIRVESIVIASNRGGGVDDRRPHEGVFLGSNDNTNWELIKLFDIDTSGYVDFQSGADSRATISDITSTSHYEYIMFVITKIATTNQYGPVQINEIEYYGIPEYDPEAHGTDVIMRSVPNVPNTDWLEVYYDAKDLADGTVATVNDLKPSGLGTALNSSSTNNITVSDGAFVFNGTTSYIKIDDLTNPSGAWTHSVVAWINSSDLGMFDLTWIGDADAATTRQSFTFQEGGQNLTLGINANNVQFTFSPPLQKSKWHHVVYTFNGGAAGSASTAYKVFVDGVEANKTGGAGTGTLSLPGDSAIWIGRNITGTNYFKGSIANFRVFNRALTGDEIWQLYAYQKEYFQVSPDVVTFKGGRLGIGTREPKAPLDVMGIPYGPGATPRFFIRSDTTKTTTAAGVVQFDRADVDSHNGFNPGTYQYTVQVAGTYFLIGDVLVRQTAGGAVTAGSRIEIRVNRGIQNSIVFASYGAGRDKIEVTTTVQGIIYLNVGDKVFMYHTNINNGDIYISSVYNGFSGILLC